MKTLLSPLARSLVILLVAGLVAAALYGLWQLPAVRSATMRLDVLGSLGWRERPAYGQMARSLLRVPDWSREADSGPDTSDFGQAPGPKDNEEPGPTRPQPRPGPLAQQGLVSPGRGEGRGFGRSERAAGDSARRFGAGGAHNREFSLAAGLRQLAEGLLIVVVVAGLVIGGRWLARNVRRLLLVRSHS